MQKSSKILVIQTAFIGDVILSTNLLENIQLNDQHCEIHILVRKGNETLFKGHPFVQKVLVWDKKSKKYSSLLNNLKTIRAEKYDKVICVQRFFNAGFLAAFSGASEIIGFKSNPLSFLFDRKVEHKFEKGIHEVDRNFALIQSFCDLKTRLPKLYPEINNWKEEHQNFITISPASVWKTKQFPAEKWIELMNRLPNEQKVFLLGGPGDSKLCQQILNKTSHQNTQVLCGKLSLLESAAIMQKAKMNFVNDSAPLHLSSAVNAPVSAVFCSTVPEFGFGPLSTKSAVIETQSPLTCRPCGLHGHQKCPQKHFNCAYLIKTEQLLEQI